MDSAKSRIIHQQRAGVCIQRTEGEAEFNGRCSPTKKIGTAGRILITQTSSAHAIQFAEFKSKVKIWN